KAFVGSKAGYYLAKWRAALKGTGSVTAFNWAACLLSGVWLPYRKMYLLTVVFMGIILLESLLEEVVFVGIMRKPEAPAALGRLVGRVAAILCGAFGNRWYLSHTRKAITEVRLQGLPEDLHLQALAKRGGTNIVAALGFFVLFVAVAVTMEVLLDALFPSD